MIQEKNDIDNYVILDTNILINNPKAINDFPHSVVIIPSIVISELDGLKNSTDRNTRMKSRIAANLIDEITERSEDSEDDLIPLDNGGYLRIDISPPSEFHDYESDKPDHRIIAVSLRIALGGYSTILYSNDTNVRNSARGLVRKLGLIGGMKARHYEGINSSLQDIDSGIKTLTIPDKDITYLRKNGYLDTDLPYLNGEHLMLQSADNPDKNRALATWDKRQRRIILLPDYKKGSPIWLIGGGMRGSTPVIPKDARQAFLANDILDTSKNLHFVLSRVAGAGKTFLVTACALNLLDIGAYDRLLIIKPMIAAGGEDLGFLPGDKEMKIACNFESFNDTMSELTNERGLTADIEAKIELDVITHMRGRTIPRTIMIIDEAQNMPEQDIKTLGTRLGEEGKLILMGDLSQIDNLRLDAGNSGLRIWADRARNPELGYDNSTYIFLDSNYRSEISEWFSSFYE